MVHLSCRLPYGAPSSAPCSAIFPAIGFGRKATLIATGTLFLVSALGSAVAPDPYSFSILRFIGGLGVGASSIVVPAYISEIAPANYRGRLVALYQFQIVFGILIAFFSNYALSEFFNLNWRWMLGAEVLPARRISGDGLWCAGKPALADD